MSMIFFTFLTQTGARQAWHLLRQAHIPSRIGKTPGTLAVKGCGYGIWVGENQSVRASEVMRNGNCRYERSYRMDGGRPVEVRL